MIFKNIELYNVVETVRCDDGGYEMLRAPLHVEKHLSEHGQIQNRGSTGVELRFVVKSGAARIKISGGGALTYYGGVQAGWQTSSVTFGNEPEWVDITPPDIDHIKAYRRLSDENGYQYDPSVVRLILKGKCVIYDVEGDVAPPDSDMVPKTKFLAYGSSITHGSISLVPTTTWVSQVADAIGATAYNKGYAGSARLEPEMADWLAEQDFEIATISMGANVLEYEPEKYRRHVRYFIDTISGSHPEPPIYYIDSTYQSDDWFSIGRLARFREILCEEVAKSGFKNAHYINGTELMSGSWGLTGDLVHPNVKGVNAIAQNLLKKIKELN